MPPPFFVLWDQTTLTPPTHLLKSHDGNSTSPTGTLEDHHQVGEEGDARRMPQDHPQGVVAVEVVAVAEAEERSHYLDTHRLSLLKNS